MPFATPKCHFHPEVHLPFPETKNRGKGREDRTTPCSFLLLSQISLFLLNHDGVETLGVLDVDSLHVAVQLLFGALLVVSSSGDSHTDAVGHTLDTLLPDLLVQLGVQTDVGGALRSSC